MKFNICEHCSCYKNNPFTYDVCHHIHWQTIEEKVIYILTHKNQFKSLDGWQNTWLLAFNLLDIPLECLHKMEHELLIEGD